MREITQGDLIFRPQQLLRYQSIEDQKGRLVHYTSAEAAHLILTNRSIWLRNTLFMNDFTEVEYGIELVVEYFKSERSERQPFWTILDRLTNGRAKNVQKLFDDWVPDLTTGTYICCVSEHRAEEDGLGRLSMWRAYGQPNGVAVVVNTDYLAKQNEALGAFSYPIEYCSSSRAFELFAEVEANVLKNEAYLATLGPDEVYGWVFHCLTCFALSIKHPGFAEEMEWRIIHRPNSDASRTLKPRTVSIKGAPQKVFELPLANSEEPKIEGISPEELVDQVIIGPSDHARAIWYAFVDALRDAGVPDPAARVHISNIPLR